MKRLALLACIPLLAFALARSLSCCAWSVLFSDDKAWDIARMIYETAHVGTTCQVDTASSAGDAGEYRRSPEGDASCTGCRTGFSRTAAVTRWRDTKRNGAAHDP